MGGKNKGSTQSTGYSPPAYAVEGLKDIATQAQNMFGNGGPGFNPMQRQGLDAIGMNAGQLGGQAVGQVGATLGGDYLGEGNPYLQQIEERANRNVMSGMNATFGGAGRTGGGLHQQALATALGDVSSGIYGPAYEAERNRQMQAVNQTGQALNPYRMQFDAGEMDQLAGHENLSRYADLIARISGQAGGTTTSKTPGRGAVAGALGGAATGAAIGGPWGALAGGVAGGLGII